MKKLLKNLIWLFIIGFLLIAQFNSLYDWSRDNEEAEAAARLAAKTSQSGYISRQDLSIDEFKGVVEKFSNEVDSLCTDSEVVNWASEKVSAEDVLVYVTGDNQLYRKKSDFVGYVYDVENNVLTRYINQLTESGVTIHQNVKVILKANSGEPVVEVIDLNNYSKVNI